MRYGWLRRIMRPWCERRAGRQLGLSVGTEGFLHCYSRGRLPSQPLLPPAQQCRGRSLVAKRAGAAPRLGGAAGGGRRQLGEPFTAPHPLDPRRQYGAAHLGWCEVGWARWCHVRGSGVQHFLAILCFSICRCLVSCGLRRAQCAAVEVSTARLKRACRAADQIATVSQTLSPLSALSTRPSTLICLIFPFPNSPFPIPNSNLPFANLIHRRLAASPLHTQLTSAS